MKTEIDRICGIMYTLLEHQPVIDVPYEKINDIAVALVKEGYGKVSEYETEREMLGSQIKVLKQRLNNKYVEVDNLNRDYHNSFERLKAQEREIERLKANGYRSIMYAFDNNRDKIVENIQTEIDDYKHSIKQAKIDVLNKLKKYLHTEDFDTPDERWKPESEFCAIIDKIIKEVQNGEDKS